MPCAEYRALVEIARVVPPRGLVVDRYGKELERIEILDVHANGVKVRAGILLGRDLAGPKHVDARARARVVLARHPAHHRASAVGDCLRHALKRLARRTFHIALPHFVRAHVDERHLLLRREIAELVEERGGRLRDAGVGHRLEPERAPEREGVPGEVELRHQANAAGVGVVHDFPKLVLRIELALVPVQESPLRL